MFATAFFETSDCRLKNVHNTFSAYDGINFANFSWKSDKENKSCYGYIAQDVEKILPNAVHNNIEGYKQVDYNQVNTYKLAKLEERIAKLEAIIKKYES
jgi:DNA repair ATPase RecN